MRINVEVTLDNKSDQETTVRIPAGSIFEAMRTEYGVQNIAVVKDYFFRIPALGRIKVFVEGRCLNRARGVPRNTAGRVTPFRYAGSSFDQDSVWEVTSNPDRI